jgi:hypothetical protein
LLLIRLDKHVPRIPERIELERSMGLRKTKRRSGTRNEVQMVPAISLPFDQRPTRS